MKQSMMMAALLLVATATQNAEAATCRRPDVSTDHIQAIYKTQDAADDTIAACTADIHRLSALPDQNSALAADYEARALAYETKGMGPEARADYDRGVELAPGYITWFNRSQFLTDASLFPAAVEDLTSLIALYDRTPPRQRSAADDRLVLQAHFQRAEALRRDEKFALAVDDYSMVIEANPDDNIALANRAISYSHLGDLDHDIADLTRVLELKRKDPIAYYNRGLAWRRKGDDTHALADFSAAVDYLPGMATAHLAKGEVLEHMGQKDKALAEFREAAKIQPGMPAATAAIARLGAN